MTASLIKSTDQQLPLFGSDQMDAVFFSAEESGETPEFTGVRLFSARPETYKAIVALSAEGLGAMRIGKILHVSPNTVLAVRAREPESIDIEKRRLAGLSREGARMCVEGIIEMLLDPEQLKKISLKDKGIVFGILAEKSELLSGSPTARLQTVGSPPAVEILEYLCWLRAEYERRMGLEAGKEEQNAAGAAVPRQIIEAEIVPVPAIDDKDQATIVDSEASCADRAGAPPESETRINIDQNEGVKKGADVMSINNSECINPSI